MNNTIKVCDGQIINNQIKYKYISEEEFKSMVEELKDYVLCVEGSHESSYDDSDDERWGSSSSSRKFTDYREINAENNSEHLIVIDEKIRGVVFYISQNNGDKYYRQFIFDAPKQQRFSMGYSASHSSNYVYVDKVTIVKRNSPNVPTKCNNIKYYHSSMDTYI